MSSSRIGESGKRNRKKAKSGDLEAGGSSFRSSLDGTGNIPDGGIEEFDASAWMRGGEGDEEVECDPLVVFGSGIMTMILSKLDAPSVALARLVSRDWLSVASSDSIWAPKDLIHMFRKWHIIRD